jgi:hypothetical protein
MNKLIVIITFLISINISAEGNLDNLQVRRFVEAASRIEFCGANCYRANSGESVMIENMSCVELEDLSIALNENLSSKEERLQEIRDSLDAPFYKKIFVDEDALKFEGYVLNTDLIPRVKARSLRVLRTIESNCE